MYPLASHQYTPIPQPQAPKKNPSRVYLASLYLILALISSLAITATILHQPLSSPPTSTRQANCGSSPASARARGCHFDILSYAWQTLECFDADLMSEFTSFNQNWTFYTHLNDTTDPVNIVEAMEGDKQVLYVDWQFHVVHCTFVWRQMHRALAGRGYIDSHVGSYKHTMHCQKVLLDRETGMDSVVVVAGLKYPECWEVGGNEWKASVSGVSH